MPAVSNISIGAIALLIIICIIGAFSLYRWYTADRRKRQLAQKAISESAGVFDAAAAEALAALDSIAEPTAGDYFSRARIRHLNVLEGEVAAPTVIADDAADDYLMAMIAIADEPPSDTTEFMLRQIDDFTRDYNDVVLRTAYDTTAPAITRDVIAARRAKAADAPTKVAAAEIMLDDATKYTSDAQNVHDSGVNSDLRATLRKLKSTATTLSPSAALTAARAAINSRMTGKRRHDALRVIDRVAAGEIIGTYGDSEDRIFAYTWDRCSHPRNAERRELMQDAVLAALSDSVEHDDIVCINGRCSRVLNSLVTLDFDEDVAAGAMTYEAYRNQIFQETKDIITRIYDADDADEARMNASIRKGIDENIAKYTAKLPADALEKIKEECYIYGAVDD